ncbi:porin [Cupriavidus oxalaticus]|uniref:porin n=1 Tax=Cupriavidus oxalaticus TaxID=96344 RepID=UPI003178F466
MKPVKLTVAVSLAALMPTLASAQSITIYGVVDTGVEYVNNVGASKDNLFRMPSLKGTVPSRWGMRGSEDLGGGLKSIFVLESGFSPDTGVSNQGGRLFGQQALVGLSGKWGQISFGRQYTMQFWSTLDADILGPNIYGLGSLDSYIPNARADNAIVYKGTFGGLTVGGSYSFGRDTANAGPGPAGTNCAGENPADKRACREWSVLIRYETGWWGTSVAYDSIRGGPGAFGGLTRSSLSDDRLSVNGYMILSRAKLGIGWLRRDNEATAPSISDLWFAGLAYDITPAFTLAGQAYYLKYHSSSNKAPLFALRGTYNFSKRTSVYATGGYINNGGQLALSVSGGAPGSNPPPGSSQFGAMVGVKHIF